MDEICFVIRKQAITTTRLLPKSSAREVARAGAYEGKGPLFNEWANQPEALCVPSDYGLLVMDFDRKWVGGTQEFTSFSSTILQEMSLEQIKDETHALWRQGRLVGLTFEDACPTSAWPDFQGWWDHLLASQSEHVVMRGLAFEVRPLPGWTIKPYQEDMAGWEAFASDLLAMGHVFSHGEISGWGDFARYRQLEGNPLGRVIARVNSQSLEVTTPIVSQSTRGPRL